MNTTFWTDEKLDELERLWQNGLTTYAIARHLGCGGNAVCGKVFRLKHKWRPKDPGKPSPPRRLDILELNDRVCRWPFGEHPPYAFCGAATDGHPPYCQAHRRLASPRQ